jgi:hypothetical protein
MGRPAVKVHFPSLLPAEFLRVFPLFVSKAASCSPPEEGVFIGVGELAGLTIAQSS